jgi:ketosteroid isomerase-like protein
LTDAGANEAVVRRGFDLFNAGDLDGVFEEVFHPEIDYAGDPDISALAGFPAVSKGADQVRAVWAAFFAMFDAVELSDISLEPAEGDTVVGSAHMLTRGGSSEVPIDAPFHFAWVVRDGRWRFMAAKLNREQTLAALADWRDG